MSAPAVIVPSLGGTGLVRCLDALAAQELPPARVVVVASGPGAQARLPAGIVAVRSPRRLGFAAAVNAGLAALPEPWGEVALLNDDALPAPGWLGALAGAMAADRGLAAVQGTVTDGGGRLVDGRGIALDATGLPVQVDRGRPADDEPAAPRAVLAVSGTAALFRGRALAAVRLPGGAVLDPRFGSYHEDLDLGLRLQRLGLGRAFVPGAPVRHLGSATGRRFPWRHPWWILANRWRAVAGNLTAAALAAALPRLVRGEIRAVRTLARDNPRVLPVAVAVWPALPVVVGRALARPSPGPRLAGLPWGEA